MLKAVILQMIATLVAAGLSAALFGVSGAISAAGAGLAVSFHRGAAMATVRQVVAPPEAD